MTATYRKNGGLHFVRVWRLSASFCLCRHGARAMPAPRKMLAQAHQGTGVRSLVIDGRRVLARA